MNSYVSARRQAGLSFLVARTLVHVLCLHVGAMCRPRPVNKLKLRCLCTFTTHQHDLAIPAPNSNNQPQL